MPWKMETYRPKKIGKLATISSKKATKNNMDGNETRKDSIIEKWKRKGGN